MTQNMFVVYAPPSGGYPYLAAMIMPTGKVEVEAFATAAEAKSHNDNVSLLMYKPL